MSGQSGGEVFVVDFFSMFLHRFLIYYFAGVHLTHYRRNEVVRGYSLYSMSVVYTFVPKNELNAVFPFIFFQTQNFFY